MIGGQDGLAAIGAHLPMTSVVQQDHVSAVNLARDFSFDYLCGRSSPVIAGNIPHDRLQTNFAGHAEDGGAASAKRWTKEIRVLTDCVLQSGATVRELFADFGCTLQSEQRVRECVIANDVSSLDDLADDIGSLLHKSSD